MGGSIAAVSGHYHGGRCHCHVCDHLVVLMVIVLVVVVVALMVVVAMVVVLMVRVVVLVVRVVVLVVIQSVGIHS